MSLMPAPTLEHVTDLTVFVSTPIEVGQTGAGQRRLIPITGGNARGPGLNGTVLAGGADKSVINRRVRAWRWMGESTGAHSTFARKAKATASMLRDLQAGGRTEAAHVVGDMLRRVRAAALDPAALAAAWCHLQVAERQRLARLEA